MDRVVWAGVGAPEIVPCSPLCGQVFAREAAAAHREGCALYARFLAGVMTGRWPSYRHDRGRSA